MNQRDRLVADRSEKAMREFDEDNAAQDAHFDAMEEAWEDAIAARTTGHCGNCGRPVGNDGCPTCERAWRHWRENDNTEGFWA